jgi:hypothetical protein
MPDSSDSRPKSTESPTPRKSVRVGLTAEVILRRTGQPNYRVQVHDISPDGCKLEFVERPRLDELVWLKFEGLEALEACVCWVEDFVVGVEYERPIHPAVFQTLVDRLSNS